MTPLATALGRLPALRALSLAAMGLKLSGATRVVHGLPQDGPLTKLDLSGNSLTRPGGAAPGRASGLDAGLVFAKALAEVQTLSVRRPRCSRCSRRPHTHPHHARHLNRAHLCRTCASARAACTASS